MDIAIQGHVAQANEPAWLGVAIAQRNRLLYFSQSLDPQVDFVEH